MASSPLQARLSAASACQSAIAVSLLLLRPLRNQAIRPGTAASWEIPPRSMTLGGITGFPSASRGMAKTILLVVTALMLSSANRIRHTIASKDLGCNFSRVLPRVPGAAACQPAAPISPMPLRKLCVAQACQLAQVMLLIVWRNQTTARTTADRWKALKETQAKSACTSPIPGIHGRAHQKRMPVLGIVIHRVLPPGQDVAARLFSVSSCPAQPRMLARISAASACQLVIGISLRGVCRSQTTLAKTLTRIGCAQLLSASLMIMAKKVVLVGAALMLSNVHWKCHMTKNKGLSRSFSRTLPQDPGAAACRSAVAVSPTPLHKLDKINADPACQPGDGGSLMPECHNQAILHVMADMWETP